MTFLKLTTAAVAALSLGTGCCCCCGGSMTPEERAAWEQERRAQEAADAAERGIAMAKATDREKAWNQVHKLVRSQPVTEATSCPDDKLEMDLDSPFREEIMTSDYYALPNAKKGKYEPWEFFDSGDIESFRRWQKYPNDSNSTRDLWQEKMGGKDARFLVVLVPSARAVPTDINDPTYVGGYFEGSIDVVDLDEGTILCRAPIARTSSSSSVDYDPDGLLAGTYAEAVQRDFEENLEDAVNEALRGISDHLAVNTVGFF